MSKAVIPGRHLVGLESPTYSKDKFQESDQRCERLLPITQFQEEKVMFGNLRGMIIIFSTISILVISGMALGSDFDTAFSDSLRFGNEQNEKAHSLKVEGKVKSETLDTEMGSFIDRYPVRTIEGNGAALTVTLKAPEKGKTLLLEVQEIHNRRPDAFGYMILANGKEIYFRTYQEYGAGPNHYFVQIPSETAGKSNSLDVTFRSEGGAPFSLGNLWAYENFFEGVAAQEKIYRRMGLIIPKDLMKTPEQRQGYAELKCYSPVGLLSFSGYGFGSLDENRKGLEKNLKLSADSGMPILLIINGTGWGGKPNGPDGLGGYFSDIRYSILQYNSAAGCYRPSWPNMWGNISTPTLRDPQMNGFLEKRFVRVMGGLPFQVAMLKAGGTPAQPMLVREFAPVSGEISNFTIEKARQDGIRLDGTDGLSREERLWMYRDAVHAWQDYADSTVRVVGRDSILVDNGKILIPEEQMSDNLYAHPDFLTVWPMNDPRWCGGQIGMVDGLWSSGEMGRGNEYRDIAMYDYVRGRGKLAMINMERTILKEDFSVLKSHYQRGFQFVTLFNAYDHDEKYVKMVDGIDDEPSLPAVHREPSILEIIVRRDLNLGPKDKIQSVDNLKIHHEIRLAVGDCSMPGQITYRLENVGEPFTSKLNLHLDGRISPGDANMIEVCAGENPDSLKKVKILTEKELPCPDHWTPNMSSETTVDLGDSMIGKKTFYLRLVFHASGAPDAAFLLSLHVGTQWGRQSGHMAANPFNVRQSRIMQLWVQDRALADRWLKKYRALNGEDEIFRRASGLMQRGWYLSAYRLLSSEISQVLPAKYAIRGNGKLGRYPVEVTLPKEEQTAMLTLFKLGADGCEFEIGSNADKQSCRLTFTVLAADRKWMLTMVKPNHYRLAQGEANAEASQLSVRDGKVTVEIDVCKAEEKKPQLSQKLTARCLGGKKNQISVDCQDLELMGYEESMNLPVSKNATLSRRPDNPAFPAEAKSEWPQPLDQVELTLDEQRQVVDIKATYGYDRGRIKAFHPPVLIGELSNGILELENGNRYLLDYEKKTGTTFDTVALHGPILAYELRALSEALKPGQEIELTYCPYRIKAGLPRLRSVKQPQKVLLEEDFTKTTGDEWRQKAFSVNGAEVKMHKPEPNYLTKVEMRLLRPTKSFMPGELVYHIKNEKPLKTTAVEFTARAFEDSSRVEFFASDDGKKWDKCGQFDNTWQNNISQNLKGLPPNFIDLTNAVKGKKDFYLKVQLTVNSADERYCLGRVRVITEE